MNYNQKGSYCYSNSIIDVLNLVDLSNLEIPETSVFKAVRQPRAITNFKGNSLAKTFNKVIFGLLEEFVSYQYFFVIKSKEAFSLKTAK